MTTHTGTKEGKASASPSFRIRKKFLHNIGVTLAFLLMFLFFIVPLLRLLGLSFVEEGLLTFSHYKDVWSDGSTWKIVQNTLVMVGGSTLLALILGITFAVIVAYTDIRAKGMMHLFILLPFIIPSYIITLSWTQLFSTNGWIASLLPESIEPFNLYSMPGLIVTLGISHFPLVYLFTVGVLRKIPWELGSAARVAGTSMWTLWRTIYLPLALPGIAGGGLIAFLANLDNFGIPAFLGIPANITVLSTAIYQEVVGIGPSAFSQAASLAVILGAVALLGTLFQWFIVRKSKRQEASFEDHTPRIHLKKKKKWVEGFSWCFLVSISIVPLLSMVSTSLTTAYGINLTWDSLTFEHYRYIIFDHDNTKSAIQNSLGLAGVTCFLTLVIGTFIAYIRVKRPSLWSRSAELIVGLPYALPGTVLALAIILAWMEPVPGWNPGIYGSIFILLIAYVTRFMILQVRGSATALTQVDPTMEEASKVSGAGFIPTWRKVMTPLLLPGMISGAFLVFLSALTELTVSALLYASGTQTIGVTIFQFEQAGYTTQSTALSSLVVALMFSVIAILLFSHKIWKKRTGRP